VNPAAQLHIDDRKPRHAESHRPAHGVSYVEEGSRETGGAAGKSIKSTARARERLFGNAHHAEPELQPDGTYKTKAACREPHPNKMAHYGASADNPLVPEGSRQKKSVTLRVEGTAAAANVPEKDEAESGTKGEQTRNGNGGNGQYDYNPERRGSQVRMSAGMKVRESTVRQGQKSQIVFG
jgi:hypothetical protein